MPVTWRAGHEEAWNMKFLNLTQPPWCNFPRADPGRALLRHLTPCLPVRDGLVPDPDIKPAVKEKGWIKKTGTNTYSRRQLTKKKKKQKSIGWEHDEFSPESATEDTEQRTPNSTTTRRLSGSQQLLSSSSAGERLQSRWITSMELLFSSSWDGGTALAETKVNNISQLYGTSDGAGINGEVKGDRQPEPQQEILKEMKAEQIQAWKGMSTA